MAEIDINNLGDAAAIANTDDILAIINGLGKNLNWAKLKEQLVRELPVATNNSNGLMSASDKKSSFIKSKGDANSSLSNGVYTIRDSDINNPTRSWATLVVFEATEYTTQLLVRNDGAFAYIRVYTIAISTFSKWRCFSYDNPVSAFSDKENVLTETIIEDVPISPNTPMTLQLNPEDEQVTQERYVYSIRKMAEAILLLQKELSDLKAK